MSKILVIDDDRHIRALLRKALESGGFEVVEARNGMDGVRLFRSDSADLVITDILMPEMEGIQCIQELRQVDPAVPIIAISGGSTLLPMDVLEMARRLGADRVFSKPFDLDKLLAGVREELAA